MQVALFQHQNCSNNQINGYELCKENDPYAGSIVSAPKLQ